MPPHVGISDAEYRIYSIILRGQLSWLMEALEEFTALCN